MNLHKFIGFEVYSPDLAPGPSDNFPRFFLVYMQRDIYVLSYPIYHVLALTCTSDSCLLSPSRSSVCLRFRSLEIASGSVCRTDAGERVDMDIHEPALSRHKIFR